jgi:hypothetical protein
MLKFIKILLTDKTMDRLIFGHEKMMVLVSIIKKEEAGDSGGLSGRGTSPRTWRSVRCGFPFAVTFVRYDSCSVHVLYGGK